ncbi:hemolysin family protein [Haloglycomyces albus]|uniref:hemolysin family protein n=1 Tax=Haloglycomyces albus TaxID=526067 RepID=UPI00046D7CB0|nr:hemolysin family protein [Haloglycomyces albus]
MTTTTALVVSVALLIFNAFFVAAEFALVASRSHRLEQIGTRTSRNALDATRNLSIMLAGAQLGITACTVGLGALAEPAIAKLIEPPLHEVGLRAAAHPVAFTIALIIVVFLHMVLGEMMPKSWAISHPESSATILIWPFRGFIILAKPIIVALNAMANGLLRLMKVEPADEKAQAHSPQELRYLLSTSAEAGLLEEPERDILTHAIEVQERTVGEVAVPWNNVVTVSVQATAPEVERRSRETGRSRLVVVGLDNRPVGLVHVRQAVLASHGTTARDLAVAPLLTPTDMTVSAAVALMKRQHAQLALVTGADYQVVGLVGMEDLLEEIMGEFYDETDRG